MRDPVTVIATLLAQCARLMRALRAILNSQSQTERIELVRFAEEDYFKTLGELFPEEEKGEY